MSDANDQTHLGEPCFQYSGKMYMRPVDRGAVLEEIDKQFDNDVLPDGNYVCEIRVWKAPGRAGKP